MIRITVLAEDTAPYRGHLGEHGFSLLLEGGEETVLFDAGQGLAILHNARALTWTGEKSRRWPSAMGITTILRAFPRSSRRPKQRSSCTLRQPFLASSEPSKGKSRRSALPGEPQDLTEMGAFFHYQAGPVEIGPGMLLTGPIPRRHAMEVPTEDFLIREGEGFSPDPFRDDQALVVESEEGLGGDPGLCAMRD